MNWTKVIKRTTEAVMLLIIVVYVVLPFVVEPCNEPWQEDVYSFMHKRQHLVTAMVVLALAIIIRARYIFNRWINYLAVSAVILLILSSIVLAALNTSRTKSIDAARISNIRQLQLALELYYDSPTGGYKYPESLSQLEPEFIQSIPKDYYDEAAYMYSVSEDKLDYVVGIEIGSHIPLDSCRNKRRYPYYLANSDRDLDGTILGINCDDPVYCSGPRLFR